MRRLLACSAALALAATILLPVAGTAAKTTCDPEQQIPGWESLAYSRVPLGLDEGTHAFNIAYSFVDVDGLPYEGTIDGSFDVSADVPVIAGTVWVTPWGMLGGMPPQSREPISLMNPAQPAVFVLGWGTPQYIPELSLTVTRQLETKVFHAMTQTLSLDGAAAVPMHFRQIANSCWWL